MRLGFFGAKDFWAGVVLIAIGATAAVLAREYPLGTIVRMGPGYFPTALGALLVLFGMYLLVKGLRSAEKIEAGWSPRALIVLPLSLALFGFLMDRAGLVPALAALVVGSAAAGREFRPVEVILLAGFLIVFSVAVFVWFLGLPYPVLVWR
jgi:Tripartite tricarboxylate transporter TctB family